MNYCCQFLKSSIGKNQIVAVTGLVLIEFICGHLLDNFFICSGLAGSSAAARMNKEFFRENLK